ncbi:thio:disulfide interchange protein [Novosphingobium marinum]|uniref:DsbC/DsbD-like thiol-disulfide interchange protein/cytochrome c biogenesis protein CcdA n=1 Tax=Novosphingobium marinum TaxID=1514948 RepID=A0A7Y9XUW7_9SPHN|nr:protein-disulfide reductase DsbD domain-containing protein [Novosphingobium marinum]NYH95019.1 DsbC/DsbD-like thiol-disulfide interchange protein/cytochrome c biogenesis protein CcdA [Novosphingobium marinum]GGC40823.1 thio:disulfide interchange protein [Novosphingobium marinum]
MRCYRLLVAVLLQCLACVLLPGSSVAQNVAGKTNIATDLVAEGPAMPGETITLAIRMRPDPGWHGYWSNPGDAGLGMSLDWTLPEGASAGEPDYPVPDTLLISGLMNHVFEHDYAVLVPLTLPANAKPGEALPISVQADWLACTDEICVPEQGRLATTVKVGRAEAPDPRFDRWRAALPAPLDAVANFEIEGDTVRLGIPLPRTLSLKNPHFFAATDKAIDYGAGQSFARAGDMLVITLARPEIAPAAIETLGGVLRLNEAGDGLSLVAVPGPVPQGGEPLAGGEDTALPGLPILLLAALAGGLLLNVMPCVFPILSLKAMSLARAGESDSQARSEGLAYTAGVLLACLGLGGLLLALRAAGQEVGWAFQLQEPGVVAALLLLATALTANFLGVFEFSAPGFASEGSPRGAFATGLLAAFVATPCTGPFMAAAMGAALLMPVLPAMALFGVLGLGIALPFLAIAFVPAMRRRLPRPGPWMVKFRRWMAVPMGLTALALLWLAWRIAGSEFALACSALAAVLVIVLALSGRRQRAGLPAVGMAGFGVIAVGLAGFALLPRLEGTGSTAAPGIIATKPFSQAALAQARASGKPVFAWFTADWCLTCKVNEQVAIEREATREAFERAGVVVLRGDWTRRDPAITRYLTEHGAAGVPLYVWYPPNGGKPQKLAQVLTPGTLPDLVR